MIAWTASSLRPSIWSIVLHRHRWFLADVTALGLINANEDQAHRITVLFPIYPRKFARRRSSWRLVDHLSRPRLSSIDRLLWVRGELCSPRNRIRLS
jgi:hypothetical protein